MAKLSKLPHKIFGALADFAYQMGKVGSFKNGAPSYAANVTEIQSLSNFESGLYETVVGTGAPCIQDMNAILHHTSRQVGYLMEQGISEWDALTQYYIGCVTFYSGKSYKCLVNNLNSIPSSSEVNWEVLGSKPPMAYYENIAGTNHIAGETQLQFASPFYDNETQVLSPSTNFQYVSKHTGFLDIYLELDTTEFSDGNIIDVRVKNGGTLIRSQQRLINSTLNYHDNFSCKIPVFKNDIIKFYFYHNHGSAINLIGKIIINKIGA